jgi:hypothetical protein
MRKLIKRVSDISLQPSNTPSKEPAPVSQAAISMAEQEEDFSSLPLPDRFQHKVRSEQKEMLKANG